MAYTMDEQLASDARFCHRVKFSQRVIQVSHLGCERRNRRPQSLPWRQQSFIGSKIFQAAIINLKCAVPKISSSSSRVSLWPSLQPSSSAGLLSGGALVGQTLAEIKSGAAAFEIRLFAPDTPTYKVSKHEHRLHDDDFNYLLMLLS